MSGLSVRQNTDAESAILGALMTAEATAGSAVEAAGLSAAHFGFPSNANVYMVISDLRSVGKPHDEISVIAELQQRGLLDITGGRDRISEMAATVPAVGNAKHYAEVVISLAADRKKAEIGMRLNDGLSPEGAIEQLKVLVGETTVGNVGGSWNPVDLNDALDGVAEPEPTILARDDGVCLLYDEKLHQVSAEPESCKGWFALRAAADLLEAGCFVAYFDFEATAAEIVGRLRDLGVDRDRIGDRLIYVRPHEPLVPAAFEAVLAKGPALAVFDGITEALTIHGLSLEDNADVAKWLELAPRPATRAGAAVLLIDHVKKDRESRGRYSIGAQHKLAGIDVSYGLEVVEPFGRGREGLVRVRVWKDRPGHVRTHEAGDHEIAIMRLGSDRESVTVKLQPPDGESSGFVPTRYMQRISDALAIKPGQSKTEIRTLGKSQIIDTALQQLVAGGYVEVRPEGSTKRHWPIRPFIDEEAA